MIAALVVACGARTGLDADLPIVWRRPTAARSSKRGPARRTGRVQRAGVLRPQRPRPHPALRHAHLPVRVARTMRGPRRRRRVREPMPRHAGQRHEQRLRVLRGRDGYDAGHRSASATPSSSSTRVEVRARRRRSRCRCRGASSRSSSSRAFPSAPAPDLTYAPYSADQGLAPNQITILFLSRDPAAKNDPAISDPRVLADCSRRRGPRRRGRRGAPRDPGMADAFRIRTNVPVVAYQMLPYGGGHARVTGSTLLLPTSAWATNYVIADALPGAYGVHRGTRRPDDDDHRRPRTTRTSRSGPPRPSSPGPACWGRQRARRRRIRSTRGNTCNSPRPRSSPEAPSNRTCRWRSSAGRR